MMMRTAPDKCGHRKVAKREKKEDECSLFVLRVTRRDYPIGVLLELAPEPEVSTRITPD
jgi:hypothetical protein